MRDQLCKGRVKACISTTQSRRLVAFGHLKPRRSSRICQEGSKTRQFLLTYPKGMFYLLPGWDRIYTHRNPQSHSSAMQTSIILRSACSTTTSKIPKIIFPRTHRSRPISKSMLHTQSHPAMSDLLSANATKRLAYVHNRYGIQKWGFVSTDVLTTMTRPGHSLWSISKHALSTPSRVTASKRV